MKPIWKESDIEGGAYVIRNSSPDHSENTSFASSVTYMVVRITGTKQWGLSSVNDGLIHGMHESKQALVDHLNDDRYGYRQLSGQDLMTVLKYAHDPVDRELVRLEAEKVTDNYPDSNLEMLLLRNLCGAALPWVHNRNCSVSDCGSCSDLDTCTLPPGILARRLRDATDGVYI